MSLETSVGWWCSGQAKLPNFHQADQKCSVAAVGKKAFVEAEGEGERNWVRGVEKWREE